MNKLNAIGKACPIPVIMAKKEVDNKEKEFVILVDNYIAVENLKKLSNSTGYHMAYKESNGTYVVGFSYECIECNQMLDEALKENSMTTSNHMIFVGKEYLGEGDAVLGKNLIRMYFYTLTETNQVPNYIVFINGGVKLPTLDEQIVEHLKLLVEKGSTVLSCGACLNYYELANELKVGEVTNMYSIVEYMNSSDKVITL